jgi:IMP dehydrogenase
MTPAEQAAEVIRVKMSLNGLIEKPICVYETETVAEILAMKSEKGFKFNSFPVLESNGKIVGILTKNDFDFCADLKLAARDIMTKDVMTAPEETTLDEAFKLMNSKKKKVLPLVVKNGTIAGMYIFSDVKRIKTGSSLQQNVDKAGQLRVGAAIGVGKDAFQRTEKLVEAHVDVVVIDTAHADSKLVIETLKALKKKYPLLDVVVGNVSEASAAKRLIEAGADGLKVGQGGGSICTTRIIAGIGCPQVTAIYNCAKAAEKFDVPVCADGGLRYSGDITIALGAGAHSVMLGNMFAGTKESPGEIVFWNGRQWKNYRGMGSMSAMLHKESRMRYNQGKNELVPEGVEGLVPYRGELKEVVYQYTGGLKRGMGYVGAASVKELQQKADFMHITTAGSHESHAHDVHVLKEAPNYSIKRQ